MNDFKYSDNARYVFLVGCLPLLLCGANFISKFGMFDLGVLYFLIFALISGSIGYYVAKKGYLDADDEQE